MSKYSRTHYLSIEAGLDLDLSSQTRTTQDQHLALTQRYIGMDPNKIPEYIQHLDLGESENILLAGFGLGDEIDLLLKRINQRKLFVVEPSLDSWSHAISSFSDRGWPIGQDLFVFSSSQDFVSFLEKRSDLMIPEKVVTLVDSGKIAQELIPILNNLHQEKRKNLESLKFQYEQFLIDPSESNTACLPTEATLDKAILELYFDSLKNENGKKIFLTEGSEKPNQLTPTWLVENLLENKITNIVAINQGRHNVSNFLPASCGWTSLITAPVPELMEPDQPLNLLPNDSLKPLNLRAHLALEKCGVTQNITHITCESNSTNWEEKTIKFLYVGDAPDSDFINGWLNHPNLKVLAKHLDQALCEAPAYINREDLDLILHLCEKTSQCSITREDQRNWLVELLHEHVVAAQNRRKSLVDLSENFPEVQLTIYGKGWEGEESLKTRGFNEEIKILDLLAKTQFILETDGITQCQPSPIMINGILQGACVLCAQADLSKSLGPFKPNIDYLPFANLEQLEKLCRTLTQDPSQGEKIAQQGQKTALNLSKNQ